MFKTRVFGNWGFLTKPRCFDTPNQGFWRESETKVFGVKPRFLENKKDFDIDGQPVGLGPDEKVYVDVFVATYLEM